MRKCISVITVVLLLFYIIITPVMTAIAVEDNISDNDSESNFIPATNIENNVSVNGTNGFGNLLSSEIASQQAEQQENTGNNIFSVEIENDIAEVEFETTHDSIIYVEVYDEQANELLASANEVVNANQKNVAVQLDSEQMPEYFYIKASMVDVETLQPVCTNYESPNYTRDMQEFFLMTTDYFEESKVLNFDEDKSDNFAIYSNHTKIIKENNGHNHIGYVDDKNLVYTIENIDDSISSLETGDIFTQQYGENNILIVKVAQIVIDGNTAIITGQETSLEEVFDYVKINENTNNCIPQVDTSEIAECVTYKGLVKSTSTSAKPVVDIDKQTEMKRFTFDVSASTDNSSSEQNDNKKYKISGSGSINGSMELGVGCCLKVYITSEHKYVKLKIDYDLNFSLSMSGAIQVETSLGSYGFRPVAGVYIGIDPTFILRFSSTLRWSGGFSGMVGFELSDTGGLKNISSKPTVGNSIEVEGSVFVGIDLAPKLAVICDKTLKISLSSEVGIEVKATLFKGTIGNYADEKHLCYSCLEGEIDYKFSLSVDLTIFNSNKWKWSLSLLDKTFKLANFYYSHDYVERGWGECPHKGYKCTVIVKDENGSNVDEALINRRYITDSSGSVIIYFPSGEITLTATKDDKKGVCAFYVDGPSQIIITLNMSVSDIGEDEQYYNEKYFEAIHGPHYDALFEGSNTSQVGIGDDSSVVVKHGLYYGTNVLKIPNKMDDRPVEGIAAGGFKNDKYVESVIIPQGIWYIGRGAFKDCVNLTSLTIPDSIKYIGENAFDGCPNLTSVTFHFTGNSDAAHFITYIPKLKTINIIDDSGEEGNEDLQYILRYMYNKKYRSYGGIESSLTEINVISDSKSYSSVDGVLFNKDKTVLVKYPCGRKGDYIIPDTVKKIGYETPVSGNYPRVGPIYDSAFGDCADLTSITIPKSVEKISDGTFIRCANLKSVTMCDGVISIGCNAFNNCTSLTSITIPNSVTSMGVGAFYHCYSLDNVYIPNGVTSMGVGAFSECYNLKNVNIPNGLSRIENSAFFECYNLKNVNIPDSVTSIGCSVFAYCSNLKEVKLPNSITMIDSYTFGSCVNLESINIPESVTYIADDAFERCEKLRFINLPDNLTSINNKTFQKCASITSINVSESNPYFVSDNGVLLSKDRTKVILCPVGKKTYTVPDSVTSIGDEAFYNCESLVSIDIPDSVTSIGDEAFYNCESLVSIDIPDSVTSIGDEAFYNCKSLVSIDIPSGVTSIDISMFGYCYDLTDINIKSDQMDIVSDSGVLLNKEKTEIVFFPKGKTTYKIPDSVTTIGGIFYNCKNLTNITIPNSVNYIYQYAFCDCTALKSVTVSDNILSKGINTIFYNSTLTDVTISDGVTQIGNSIFNNMASLKNVILPNSVTSIGDYAFNGCTGLTSITIPDSVTSIGDYAFNGCTGLTSITIPDSVTSIGNHVFNDCTVSV